MNKYCNNSYSMLLCISNSNITNALILVYSKLSKLFSFLGFKKIILLFVCNNNYYK